MSFSISMCVRKQDAALADEIDRALEKPQRDIQASCGLPRAILSGDDPKITIDELLETAKSVDALLITLNEKCRKDVIDRMPENVEVHLDVLDRAERQRSKR